MSVLPQPVTDEFLDLKRKSGDALADNVVAALMDAGEVDNVCSRPSPTSRQQRGRLREPRPLGAGFSTANGNVGVEGPVGIEDSRRQGWRRQTSVTLTQIQRQPERADTWNICKTGSTPYLL